MEGKKAFSYLDYRRRFLVCNLFFLGKICGRSGRGSTGDGCRTYVRKRDGLGRTIDEEGLDRKSGASCGREEGVYVGYRYFIPMDDCHQRGVNGFG